MQSKVFPEMELTFECSWDVFNSCIVFPALLHLIQLIKHSLISSWVDTGAGGGKKTNLHSIVGLQALGLAPLIPSSNTPDAFMGRLRKHQYGGLMLLVFQHTRLNSSAKLTVGSREGIGYSMFCESREIWDVCLDVLCEVWDFSVCVCLYKSMLLH